MNTDQKIQQLEKQVAELTKKINALENYSTIPLSVQKALEQRDFITTENPDIPPSGAEIAGMGFLDEISLTGNPQTITVAAQPTQFLKCKSKNYSGVPFYIPIFFL